MFTSELDELLERDSHGKAAKSAQAQAHIVVIDDDPSLLHALGIILSRSYQTRLFESANEAINAINDHTMAAIIDVKMKERDGFSTADAITARRPYLPIIFYSAYQDIKNPYEVINRHHPFGYLTKGDDVDVLLEMLESAVGRYSKLKEWKDRDGANLPK